MRPVSNFFQPRSLPPWPVEGRFAPGDCVVVEPASGAWSERLPTGIGERGEPPLQGSKRAYAGGKSAAQRSPSRARGSVAFGSLGDFVFHVPVEFSVRLA